MCHSLIQKRGDLGQILTYHISKEVNCHNFSNKVDLQLIKIDWFPSYSELRKALEVYGFVFLPEMEAGNASKFPCIFTSTMKIMLSLYLLCYRVPLLMRKYSKT